MVTTQFWRLCKEWFVVTVVASANISATGEQLRARMWVWAPNYNDRRLLKQLGIAPD
jgi:hypothetical protein